MAIDKDDGDLSDAKSFFHAEKIHFDLERVAVGTHLFQVYRLQNVPAKTLETAGTVGYPQSGDNARIHGREVTQEESPDRPVDYADAVQVAGSNHEIVCFGLLEQVRNAFRIVGKVGVHLDDVSRPCRKGYSEAFAVRRSESQLALASMQEDSTFLFGHCLYNVPRPVRGVVINNQNTNPFILGQNLWDQPRDISPLIVCGDYNGNIHSRQPIR